MYDKMNGIGAHEVIIETPDHAATLADLPERQIEEVLGAFKDRVNDLKRDRRFRYIILFQEPRRGGRRLARAPHSQLIALPVIPKRAKEETGRRPRILRAEGALHFLRHHPPGKRLRRVRLVTGDRALRRDRALRAAVSL